MKKKTNEIGAAEFKAKCLALIDEVSEKGKEFVVTKRGMPKAKLVPVETPRKSLKGSVLYEAPDAWADSDEWEMEKD
jgi:prevent-host-death family protein